MKCARYDEHCDCPACEADRAARPLECDYQSLRPSGKSWTALFDLGSRIENNRAALEVAWKHNANIVGHRWVIA